MTPFSTKIIAPDGVLATPPVESSATSISPGSSVWAGDPHEASAQTTAVHPHRSAWRLDMTAPDP
jgi:hypothetical protein